MTEPDRASLTGEGGRQLDPSLLTLRDALAARLAPSEPVAFDALEDREKLERLRAAEAVLEAISSLGYRLVAPESGVEGEALALEDARRQLSQGTASMSGLRDLWSGRDGWGMDIPTIQKLSGMALELGELGLVYEIGGKGLELDPGNPRLAQQLALAHVHDGHHDRAREIIAPIAEVERLAQLEPAERGEVLAVMGRIHKEIYRQTRDQADLERACDSYRLGLR